METCWLHCSVGQSWCKNPSITRHPRVLLMVFQFLHYQSVSLQNLYLVPLKILVILVFYYTIILVLAISIFWKSSRGYLPTLLAVILESPFWRKPEFYFNQWLLGLWTALSLKCLWGTTIIHFDGWCQLLVHKFLLYLFMYLFLLCKSSDTLLSLSFIFSQDTVVHLPTLQTPVYQDTLISTLAMLRMRIIKSMLSLIIKCCHLYSSIQNPINPTNPRKHSWMTSSPTFIYILQRPYIFGSFCSSVTFKIKSWVWLWHVLYP